MLGTLVVIAGPDTNTKYVLEEKQTLVIGRGADTTTKLKDPEVSRRHCQVQQEGNVVVLTDIGSAAGTVVNGKKITRHVMKTGDVIHIGGTQLRWLSGTGSEHEASTMMVKPPSAEDHQVHVDAMMHLVGQKLSHYTIGTIIARGNSSIIFKATDDDNKNQVVALKVLSPSFTSNDEERQRFVRAMKTMLPIKHPNIVTLYAAGRQVDHCWMAMEFVEGESLNKVIERIGVANMLDWRYALSVGIQIARALEHAHKQNIIHRNITPTNILMRKADKVAKLSDLMLAKALEGTNALQVTKPGELVGELPFMSPERTQGAGATVDGRSDLYGLGATMYALVTGRPPAEGTSLIDTVQKIRNVDPVKPKKYQLSIPDQFEGILMQLLAKRPEDRIASATDLLQNLERIAKFNGVTV